MRAGRAPALLLALALPLVGGGCLALDWVRHRPPVLETCPGPLPEASGLPEGFRRRARARVVGEGVDQSFTVVLEGEGSSLAVLGLTRLGGKAFALRQRGPEVEIVSPRSPGFPLPPESLLRDLHAAELLAKGAPARVARRGCGYELRLVPLEEAAAPEPGP